MTHEKCIGKFKSSMTEHGIIQPQELIADDQQHHFKTRSGDKAFYGLSIDSGSSSGHRTMNVQPELVGPGVCERDARRDNVTLREIDKRLEGVQEMIEAGNTEQALRALVALRVVTRGSR